MALEGQRPSVLLYKNQDSQLLLELGVQSLVHLLLNLYVADRIEAFIADNGEEVISGTCPLLGIFGFPTATSSRLVRSPPILVLLHIGRRRRTIPGNIVCTRCRTLVRLLR